jgi:hypothetical protein
MANEAEIEHHPGAHHIAADRRIHEAGEERRAADAEKGRIGVDPGADRGLEDLHRRSDEMKQQDHLGFLQALETRREQQRLNGERGQEEKIIAREEKFTRIEEMGRDQQADQRQAEQARPRLLHAES